MKSREKKDVQITLTLNQFEARWLKDVVQNPLNATGNPELESPRDAEIRRVFWDELNKYDLSLPTVLANKPLNLTVRNL